LLNWKAINETPRHSHPAHPSVRRPSRRALDLNAAAASRIAVAHLLSCGHRRTAERRRASSPTLRRGCIRKASDFVFLFET
jgi:hypothetical protein